jgi:hypothetical protein
VTGTLAAGFATVTVVAAHAYAEIFDGEAKEELSA